MERCIFYPIFSALLGFVTLAAVTSVNSVNLSDPSVLDLWLFFLPMSIVSPGAGSPATVLGLWVMVYAVQYLALIWVAGTVVAKLNRSRGATAERTFEKAAASYYGASAGQSYPRS